MDEKETKTEQPVEKKEDVVEVTETDLKSLIGDAVKSATGELQTEIKDLKARQERLVGEPPALETKERNIKESKIKFAPKRKNRDQMPIDEFSFCRFFEAQMSGNWKNAEYERYALDESLAKRKALAWASGSTGGYYVGTEFLPQEFVEVYQARQVTRQAGVRVLPCTGAPVNIPKATSSVTKYWTTQNATITASDVTPAQLQLTPKFLTARSQFSRFLFQSSAGTAEDIIRNDMAAVMAVAIDDAVLEGGGTDEPSGMAATASINTVTAGNEAITMADLRDMEYELQKDNAKFIKPAWFMNPRTWHAVSELLINSETNHFLFSAQPEMAVKQSILGYPVYITTSVSITNSSTDSGDDHANVILADMNDVILAEWEGIDLAATDVGGNAWAQNAIEVRAIATVDVGVRNPNSICLLSDTTS